jgi:hypothetical protein
LFLVRVILCTQTRSQTPDRRLVGDYTSCLGRVILYTQTRSQTPHRRLVGDHRSFLGTFHNNLTPDRRLVGDYTSCLGRVILYTQTRSQTPHRRPVGDHRSFLGRDIIPDLPTVEIHSYMLTHKRMLFPQRDGGRWARRYFLI